MILFIKLLLAHLLGDFVFQSDRWVDDKMKRRYKSPYLYIHGLVHLILIYLLCYNDFPFFIPLLIIISHLIIDLAKIYFTNKKQAISWFILDQFLHVLVLLAVAQWYNPFINEIIPTIDFKLIALLLIFFILLTKAGSILIKLLISRWTPETSTPSLESAGSFIGVLERLFVFGFVVTGRIEAIGFLLAAKSVFRFGDLKDGKMKLTEYILIGTLLSFGWAILLGIIYNSMLSH